MQSANPRSLESIKARLASRNLGAPKNVTKTIQVDNLPLPPKLKTSSTKNNQFLDKSSNILQKSSNAAAIVKSSSNIINNISTQISAPAITSSVNPSTSNNYNKNKLFTDMKNRCKLERARTSALIQFDNNLSRSASSSSQMSSGSSTNPTANPSLQININNNDSNQIKKIDRIKEKIRNQKAQRIMAIIDQDSDIPENLRMKIKKKASNKVLGQEIHSVNSKVQKMSVTHCQVNNDNIDNVIQKSETSSTNSTNNNKVNNKTTPKLQKSASLFDNYRAEKIAKCIPKNQNDPQKQQQANVNSDLENSSNNHQKLVQAAKNRRKALQKMVGINVKDFNENQKAIRQTMLANLAERRKQEELKEKEKEKEKEKQEKQKQKLIEQQIIDENNENLMTSFPPRAQYRSMLAPLRNSGVKKR